MRYRSVLVVVKVLDRIGPGAVEYGDIVRIPVDSDWVGSEERCSTHAGLEFHGGHLVDSWVASDQVRALSSGEANRGWLGTRNLHEAHVRRDGTNHQHRCRDGLDGYDRDVLPNGRWKDKTHPSSIAVDPRRHS